MPLRNKILQFLCVQSPASSTTIETSTKPQTKTEPKASFNASSTSSFTLKPMSSLANQTVLVVGGSSGLGFGAAKAAHREGAKVILASSSESKIAAAVQRLGGPSNTLVGAVIDVKTEGGVKAFFEKHGAVDHVVYTAGDGIIGPKQFPGLNLDTSRDMWDVRYWGVLNIGKHAPQYVRQSITCTGGGAGDRPPPGWSAIAPVIGALPTLVAALSIDIAPIRVNVILPGSVKTEMWEMLPEEARNGFFAAQAEKLPVKHVADADEIAEAYLFAMKCKYFTGQSLKVDGGAAIV